MMTKRSGLDRRSTNISLTVKPELIDEMLDDPKYKNCSTDDLIDFARSRKRVHVTDRASAIAAIRTGGQ